MTTRRRARGAAAVLLALAGLFPAPRMASARQDLGPAPHAGPDAALVVRARNVFLEPGLDGWAVTDVFWVENTTGSALGGGAPGPAWTHPLPEAARDLQLTLGDAEDPRLSAQGSRIGLAGPLEPGRHAVVARYALDDPFVPFPQEGLADRVEVLVSDAAPPLRVVGLAPLGTTEPQPGFVFRRFGARDFSLPEFGLVTAAGTPAPSSPAPLAAGLAVALLLAAGVFLASRSRRADGGQERRRLLLEIARLDEAQARAGADQASYAARRRDLVSRLRRLA